MAHNNTDLLPTPGTLPAHQAKPLPVSMADVGQASTTTTTTTTTTTMTTTTTTTTMTTTPTTSADRFARFHTFQGLGTQKGNIRLQITLAISQL